MSENEYPEGFFDALDNPDYVDGNGGNEDEYPEGFLDALDDPDYVGGSGGDGPVKTAIEDVLDQVESGGEGYEAAIPEDPATGLPVAPWRDHGGIPAPALRREVDIIKRWAGGAAVGAAALTAGAALLYRQSRPPRKRKTMTRGQKLGMAGLMVGGTAAMLGGAAYLTSKVIANRVRGCKATDLFC